MTKTYYKQCATPSLQHHFFVLFHCFPDFDKLFDPQNMVVGAYPTTKSQKILANSRSKSTSAFFIRKMPETMIEVAPKFIGESGKSKIFYIFLYSFLIQNVKSRRLWSWIPTTSRCRMKLSSSGIDPARSFAWGRVPGFYFWGLLIGLAAP